MKIKAKRANRMTEQRREDVDKSVGVLDSYCTVPLYGENSWKILFILVVLGCNATLTQPQTYAIIHDQVLPLTLLQHGRVGWLPQRGHVEVPRTSFERMTLATILVYLFARSQIDGSGGRWSLQATILPKSSLQRRGNRRTRCWRWASTSTACYS